MPHEVERKPNYQNLLVIFIGIYVFFLAFGYFHERISRNSFGDNEYFDFPLFVVFIQCVSNVIISKIQTSVFYTPPSTKLNDTSIFVYISFFYTASMVAANYALLYVSYPTQILVKSSKMIPVMLGGYLMARKHYSWRKWFIVITVTLCITYFMLVGVSKKSQHHSKDESSPFGLLLICGSLFFDALTNGYQERMYKLERKPTSEENMLYTNIYAVFFLTVSIIVSGEVFPAAYFLWRFPEAIFDLLMIGLTMSFGQIFVFWCLSEFGNLTTSMITTTRKFFAIIFSVLFFGHSLSSQWFAVFIVFLALIIDSF